MNDATCPLLTSEWLLGLGWKTGQHSGWTCVCKRATSSASPKNPSPALTSPTKPGPAMSERCYLWYLLPAGVKDGSVAGNPDKWMLANCVHPLPCRLTLCGSLWSVKELCLIGKLYDAEKSVGRAAQMRRVLMNCMSDNGVR